MFGALAVLIRPELGLYASSMLTPIERLGRISDDSAEVTFSIMRIVGIGAFGVYALHFLLKRQRPYLPLVVWVLGLWVLLVGASFAWTSDPTAAKRGIGLWVGNLLFFILIINGVRSRVMVRRLLAVTLTVSVGLGLFSIYQWRTDRLIQESSAEGAGALSTDKRFEGVFVDNSEINELGARRRLAGPTSHPTVYATNLLTLIPLTVWFFHRKSPPWMKVVLLLAAGVFAGSLMLTGTRAAMITGFALAGLMLPLRLIQIRPATMALVLVAVIAVPFVLPQNTFERIFDTKQYSLQTSSTLGLRMAYWKAGWEMIQERPVLGWGYSNFHQIPKRVPDLSPESTTIHNFVIQIAAELGVIGLAVFFTFLYLIASNLIRARRAFLERDDPTHALLCSAILLTFIAPMILGMSCDWHHFPIKVWWLSVALSVVLHRIAVEGAEELAPEPILPTLQPRLRSVPAL